MSLELHISEDAPACAQLDLKQACLSASEPTGACADDSFIPWNRLFLCGGQHLDLLAYVAFIIGLVLCTSVVMWIGVNLLSKVRSLHSMLFSTPKSVRASCLHHAVAAEC